MCRQDLVATVFDLDVLGELVKDSLHVLIGSAWHPHLE